MTTTLQDVLRLLDEASISPTKSGYMALPQRKFYGRAFDWLTENREELERLIAEGVLK